MILLKYSSAHRSRAYNKLLKCIRDRKLGKMMKRKNSHQKKLQEEMTARELLKTDINNITKQAFRIIVIRLIAGLEKKHRR